MRRPGPLIALILMTAPIAAGLIGTLLPAFGYLPALGGLSASLDPWRELLAEPGLWASARLSLGTGLAATALSLAIVLAFVGGWAGTPLFARIQHLVSPLLSVPHAAAAFGLAFLIAPSGLLSRLLSPGLTGWTQPPDLLIVNDPMGLAMTAGLAAKEIPFLLLIALAALPQTDSTRRRALATSLGYGRLAGFAHGVLPPLYAQMRLAVFAVLAFSTSVVDVASILGPTTPAPLGVRLVGWMNDPDLSMRFMACAGALLQLLVSALAILLWLGVEQSVRILAASARDQGWRLRRDRWLRMLALTAMLCSACAVFGGLAVLALWSVAGPWPYPDLLPQTLTLDIWARSLPRLGKPLATTAIVALAAAAIALAAVVFWLANQNARRRAGGAHWLVYLPLLAPQAAFLFGLQMIFIAAGGLGTFVALIAVHLVFVMPYVFLSLAGPWRAFDPRFEAIAAGLGKSRMTTLFRIRLPMLAGALLTAFAIGFSVSVAQYLPTVLIGAGRLETITTEAVALAASANRRIIGVYAVVQIVLPFAGFAVATIVPALIFRSRRGMRA